MVSHQSRVCLRKAFCNPFILALTELLESDVHVFPRVYVVGYRFGGDLLIMRASGSLRGGSVCQEYEAEHYTGA